MNPRVVAAPGSYVVTWPIEDLDIVFEADRLRSHSDGRVQGRVRVVVGMPGRDPLVLHHGNLNLGASRSRRDLSKALEERLSRDSLNWDLVVEESCRTILEREEEGSPVERLAVAGNVDVEYLLGPVLLDHLPVVWYAPGGSGKSLLSMYAALLVQNGLTLHQEQGRQANVLYLDWEVTKEEADRRCTLLANGLLQRRIGASLDFPLYRRCVGAIQDEASEIAKAIAKHKIGLVFVDSAGPACGGDVMSGELAIQLFNTLRKVSASTNASVCVLTHTTKADRREENERRLPIGSIYFENLPRATWEIRPQENTDQVLQVGMFPRKQNMTRSAPVGFRFVFEANAIAVEPARANDASSEAGATSALILAELRRGPLKIADLAEAVGANPGTIRQALFRMKDKVVNPSRGVYALAADREEEL